MSLSSFAPGALWRSLFELQQSRLAYLGRALVLDLPLSLLVAALASTIAKAPDLKFNGGPAMVVFLLCVFAPVIETAVMVLLFGVLRWFTSREELLAASSALLWALLHATTHPVWGVGVFWPFFLYSVCYLQWSKRSRSDAFLMTAAFHALHNLGPALLLAFAPRS